MNDSLKQIGTIHSGDGGFFIEVAPAYRAALKGLEGFGYIQVIWWFSGCDDTHSRSTLTEKSPYKRGPETLGVFATRSPRRPNPIAVSPACVTQIDCAHGVIGLGWIDADDGTPVLDIKPYTPSVDRVEQPVVPDWCAHWPKNVEQSGDFDWSAEFNF